MTLADVDKGGAIDHHNFEVYEQSEPYSHYSLDLDKTV